MTIGDLFRIAWDVMITRSFGDWVAAVIIIAVTLYVIFNSTGKR